MASLAAPRSPVHFALTIILGLQTMTRDGQPVNFVSDYYSWWICFIETSSYRMMVHFLISHYQRDTDLMQQHRLSIVVAAAED
jgi:hypothetical protein